MGKQKAPIRLCSATPLENRLAHLRQLFPEVFVEGRVDFEKFRQVLGEWVEEGPERYSFAWAGKRDALRLLQMPTRATLVPAPEESVNWESTQNVFIEGDNLEVLKLLLRPYYGRVKMIYIDPPYNTGNDFVYRDNYADPLAAYLALTGQVDEEGNVLTSNPETSGRYHSAWLSMMYPRLYVARQLLRDDGVIFVSIDDHEVHNLRMIMNEIFGEENFIAALIWKRRQNVDSRTKTGVSVDHEYLLVYGKTPETSLRGAEKDLSKYSNPDNDPRGPWLSADLTGLATREQRPNLHYDLVNPETGEVYPCPETGWRYNQETMARLIAEGRIIWPTKPGGRPRLKRFLYELQSEFTGLSSILQTAYNLEGTREVKELFDGVEVVDFPKPVAYMKLIVQQGAPGGEDDIVLDFFAGSCSMAQAVLEVNAEDGGTRRFIMVQLPEPTRRRKSDGTWEETAAYRAGFETIADLGKERIRRAIMRLRERIAAGTLPLGSGEPDLGFRVFKLAPSNFRSWHGMEAAEEELPSADKYGEQMELFLDTLVDDSQPEDVIAEVALKEAGFGLNYRVAAVPEVEEQTVYRIEDGDTGRSFYLCLDDEVCLQRLKPLNLDRETLFVCRASALDDETAANLALQCKLRVV